MNPSCSNFSLWRSPLPKRRNAEISGELAHLCWLQLRVPWQCPPLLNPHLVPLVNLKIAGICGCSSHFFVLIVIGMAVGQNIMISPWVNMIQQYQYKSSIYQSIIIPPFIFLLLMINYYHFSCHSLSWGNSHPAMPPVLTVLNFWGTIWFWSTTKWMNSWAKTVIDMK